MRATVGADLGGTKLTAGVVVAGRVRHHHTTPTPAPQGPAAVLAALLSTLHAEVAWARREGLELAGIGIGAAGTIVDGVVTHATATLPGWVGTDVGTAVRDSFGCPVAVVNDVHAAALGEAATSGGDTVLVVAVGTGVGGAIVHRGQLVIGRTGSAGAVGHLTVPRREQRRCSCGGLDHLEAYVAGPAIAAAYALAARLDDTLDLRVVVQRARAGDAIATAVIADAGDVLGRALGGLLNVLDPDVVVLTGGVVELGDLFLDPATAALREHALPGPATTALRTTAPGSLAAILGAARAVGDNGAAG